MRKWRSVALILALFLLMGIAQPAFAQRGITVTSNTYEFSFPKEITFHLEAQSGYEINEITLLCRIGMTKAKRWAHPDFTPGKKVSAEYIMHLQRGEIPPFSRIEYFWRIEDAAGNELDTEPVTFEFEDNRFTWDSLSEDNVILYWYGADRAFGQRLLDSAVKALAHLEEEVGVKTKETVKIVVYQSKADMQEATIWRGRIFESQIITLGMVVAPNIVLLLGDHPEVDRTIAHELTHVVVGLATENPYAEIPAWLNEGLAMYNEGELRGGNAAALEEAIRRNQLIPVRSMTSPPGEPEKVNLFYGEAYSIVEFLLKTYGKEKMADLLAVFKEGTLTDDALERVYGFDQDGLEVLWREYIGAPPKGEVTEVTPTPALAPEVEKRPQGWVCCGLLPGAVLAVAALLVLKMVLR